MSNKAGQTTNNKKRISLPSLAILVLLAIAFYFTAGKISAPDLSGQNLGEKNAVYVYLSENGELPDYYITKMEARALGWSGGGLEDYAPGKMIGGDRFANAEGLLPKKSGRSWTEADIGTMGKDSRGAERIVFSSDGLIYYTGDHYEGFELLGEVK